MVESRRNNGSVFLVFFLMLVFFSFIQSERKKHVPASSVSSLLASPANSSGPQAILVPASSAPEIFGTSVVPEGKYTFHCCITIPAIIVNEQNSAYFCSFKSIFLSYNPGVRLTLRQKVPGNENSDDPIPVI